MSLLKKLFRLLDAAPSRPRTAQPAKTVLTGPPLEGLEHIPFGHYSDNNRSPAQRALWGEAENLFNAGRHQEAIETLLRYLHGEAPEAVSWQKDENGTLHFEIAQGSSLIKGTFDGAFLHASVPLARAEQPGTAVMRRLLELNYELRYTSVGLDEAGTFYFVFDTDAATASPYKLFEGLEELAIKADRQDDNLLTDFKDLSVMPPRAPVEALPEGELQAKWQAFRRWTSQALKLADTFDSDTYAGAIAHIYLSTIYRLDFLLAPDGRLMLELERISGLYWKQKDDKPLVLRNQQMRAALQALLGWSKAALTQCLRRTRSTFSVTDNPRPDKMRDNILTALRDAATYQSRKQSDLAIQLIEYGPLYNRYLYTLPNVVSQLTIVLCAVMHPRFFADLGLQKPLYNLATQTLDDDLIKATIRALIAPWKEAFPNLALDLSKVDFTNRFTFGNTYAAQLSQLVL